MAPVGLLGRSGERKRSLGRLDALDIIAGDGEGKVGRVLGRKSGRSGELLLGVDVRCRAVRERSRRTGTPCKMFCDAL